MYFQIGNLYIHTQILRICVCICIASTNVCMHMRAYSVSKQDTTYFGSLQLLLLIHCVRSITLTLAYALTHTLTHMQKADTAVDGVLSLSCIL